MTRTFLETKIRTVFTDFSREESWCDLNNSELTPENYSLPVNQQKYILKYYGAYFCELYGMYEKFLRSFRGTHLNVLSLGCGSGVDCEALNRVRIDLGLDLEINYVGIDIVNWNYRPDFAWADFQTKCASEIAYSDVELVDLFIFPKSLTEIPNAYLVNIGDLISTKSNLDNVFFINTYVTDNAESSRVDGLDQFGAINRLMESNGWDSLSEPGKFYYKIDGNWLGRNFNFFKLPDELKPFVEELKGNCQNQNQSEDCSNCDIDFIPILNSRYLAYNLLEYKRK